MRERRVLGTRWNWECVVSAGAFTPFTTLLTTSSWSHHPPRVGVGVLVLAPLASHGSRNWSLAASTIIVVVSPTLPTSPTTLPAMLSTSRIMTFLPGSCPPLPPPKHLFPLINLILLYIPNTIIYCISLSLLHLSIILSFFFLYFPFLTPFII